MRATPGVFIVLGLVTCSETRLFRGLNEPCENNTDCADNICHAGVCASSGDKALRNGQPCWASAQCRSFSCSGGICVPGAGPKGTDCLYDEECAARLCVDGRCGALGDGGNLADALRPDQGSPDLGPVTTRQLVVSRLLLPDPTLPLTVGHDYNADGSVDNALGSMLGTISDLLQGLIQAGVDIAVSSGKTLLLISLEASSSLDDPHTTAHIWIASDVCCSNPLDLSQCAMQAKGSCFSGSHVFQLPTGAQESVLQGTISTGHMVVGPASIKLALPLGVSNAPMLTLKAAYLEGTWTTGSLTGGVLAGVVPKADVQAVVAGLAQLLDGTLHNPSVGAQTKSVVASLFDGNMDGSISSAEIAGSSVVKSFLAGDVDVDGDGANEVSLGLTFESATATITP